MTTTSQHTDDQAELTPADIADGIRRELATIRRHWPHTFDPPNSGGNGNAHGVPDSRFPGNDTAISLRAEVTRDLAFWLRAVMTDADLTPTYPRRVPVPTLTHTTTWTTHHEPATLHLDNVPAMCVILERQTGWISAWPHGNRLWAELITLAREVRDLASPRVRDTIALGECECGTTVRAKAHDPGNIKCPGCGTTDTIDGWTLRIVGHHELVTIPQLVPILHKRMGIVITERQLRRWHQSGRFAATNDGATPKFDRRDVFTALAYLEHRHRQGA